MSVSIIYGVFCSISTKDMTGYNDIKGEKEQDRVYEIWRKDVEQKIKECTDYDEEINEFCLDFANSEDLHGSIIGINLKTLKVEYSGAMDITEIKSKVTDEVKNKITNMVIQTKLFNYIKSLGKIWVYHNRDK